MTDTHALFLAVRLMDLTTLEATDTEAKVVALCERALRPSASRPEIGPVAAVCVYPSLVPAAKRALRGSPVKLASVAGAFPSGLSPLDVRVFEVERAVELGADEIDTVIDRGAMLSGQSDRVEGEIAAIKSACGEALLKVILETSELRSRELIREASLLAMRAGADFIKTSTGKASTGATPEATQVMLEAIRDFERDTGKRVGIKVAGGIRTSRQALDYMRLVEDALGSDWLSPSLFRIGASSLLDDVIRAIDEGDG